MTLKGSFAEVMVISYFSTVVSLVLAIDHVKVAAV